jgi:hypothetical protein
MLQVYHLDVAYIYNGFQVFLGVFQVLQTYVVSILSGYCKSRYGIVHVVMGAICAAVGHRAGA